MKYTFSVDAVNDVLRAWSEEESTAPRREFLGLSGIGDPCVRRLWYDYRWATERKISNNLQRIFDRGHLEEERVIRDLKSIGILVFALNPPGSEAAKYAPERELFGTAGEEQEEVLGHFPHVKSKIDGRCKNVPGGGDKDHLLEIKTMNQNSFNKLIKDGVEKSHPKYYAQVQIYMDVTKLERCLFVAVNKNNEAMHAERVKRDPAVAERLREVQRDVIFSRVPPPKLTTSSGALSWECKFCPHIKVCANSFPIGKSCRACVYCDAVEADGEKIWCSLVDVLAPRDFAEQKEGCEHYEPLCQ